MKTSFESLMESIVPEINFLTSAGSNIKPGTVLESQEKEIPIGYLPGDLQDNGIANNRAFETMFEDYDIREDEIDGMIKGSAALKFMKIVGLKYKSYQEYEIDFDITNIKAELFKENLLKIFFEQALNQLKKKNRRLFRRYRGHFLVTNVIYAESFEVEVKVKKNGEYLATVDINDIDVEVGASKEVNQNSLLVSNNNNVPIGVIGFKIKGNKLKEVD
ncbi:hypothetical protein E9993_13675 [Labilibacter sediminis]|nr:hypothetical protein E9993_13675 [Labilibacter sediminis]